MHSVENVKASNNVLQVWPPLEGAVHVNVAFHCVELHSCMPVLSTCSRLLSCFQSELQKQAVRRRSKDCGWLLSLCKWRVFNVSVLKSIASGIFWSDSATNQSEKPSTYWGCEISEHGLWVDINVLWLATTDFSINKDSKRQLNSYLTSNLLKQADEDERCCN